VVLSGADLADLLSDAAGQYAAGRLDDAARIYQRIERENPGEISAVYSLAVVDIRRGRLASARAGLRRVIAHEPEHFTAQHNLGAVCQQLGRWREAARAYRRALALRPDADDTHFRLAVALAVSGLTKEAVACYRTLAAQPSTRARALTRLAVLDAGAISDGELCHLRCAADDPRLDREGRLGALFALGEVLEKRGAIDAAFIAFAAGNRLKHESLVSDALDGRSTLPDMALLAHSKSISFVRGLVDREFIDARQGDGAPSPAPIFIVGMPRCGSTLIEQILSSHSKVQGLGETAAISDLLARGYPSHRRAPVEHGHVRGLADGYLSAMRARGWKGASRFVDKSLENHLHIGMIHLMFPRSVILHSVRDPVDTCLSCYRQLFASGNETLYDLRRIGAEYVAYRSMMDHWASILPGRVIDVRHEALVAAPESEIPWLVTTACGLAWDPACLRFHETRRAVKTASAGQVRRPIFTSSVRRWRRYRKHLQPLFEALGPYAPKERAA